MAIAFDAAGGAQSLAQPASLTWSHTCTGSNLYLIVVVGMSAGTIGNVTGVTYNGVAMTALWNVANTNLRCTGWGLKAPAAGAAHNVIASFSGANDEIGGLSISYSGVDQTVPTGTANTASGNDGTSTVNITSASGELVVDGSTAISSATQTIGAGQTQRASQTSINTTSVYSSEEAGAASVTMSWTHTADQWGIGGVPLKPAAASTPPPNGSNDYYSVPPSKQASINATMPRLAPYESYPPQGLVPSPAVPYGKTDYYDARLFSQTLRGAKPQWQQHDAYAMRFVQQNPPPGSGGFPWYYDRTVYPKLRFRDQHETYPARGNVPSPVTPVGWTAPYDSRLWASWRRPRPEMLVYDGQATASFVFVQAPSGSVSFFDFDKYPALQFRHQHESYPALGSVPTAATPQGWSAFYDVEVVPRTKAALADHESAEFTFYPSRPLWTDFYDAEVIKPRAFDYTDVPSSATQAAVVVATGWGAFYDSNLNMLPPRRAAEGAIYDAETPEVLVAFIDFGAYYDRARLRPILTQQHDAYPALGLVPTAATPQGWWLPFDVARVRPVPTSLQQFDGYQHFLAPVAVNLGPLGWSMFWDKGRRPLSADRMPFLFEQLYQTPTAATPQGWTHLLDTARGKAFPARLQQYDGLQRLSFVPPFITLPGDWYDVRIIRPRARDYQVIDRPMFVAPPFPFDQVDARVIRPRAFPYSVVDQQPTVVVPPSAYVLFPDLFKRPRAVPYLTWPEQRVAVLNTPPGTGGPTYFYDRRLFVAHRPLAEVVPFDGRGLPFVVVNIIIHRPGKGGLLTPVLLAATKGQPTLAGIRATPTLGGEVED